MAWSDVYKIWKLVMQGDPLSRRSRSKNIESQGVSQPDAVPDVRADGSFWSGGRGVIKLRDSSDFIDLSSVTNRQSRYKEYERLRSTCEIETAMTVFADEACVVGDTLIATPTLGYISIKELTELKKPDEEFLVYCFDFQKHDFTLGWAFHPRLVKKAPVVRVILSDGTDFVCTDDHKVLLRNGEWKPAGELETNDYLMPFYRTRAEQRYSNQRKNQFARVWTLKDGWKTERQFLDEWRSGKQDEQDEQLYKVNRMICQGLNTRQISEMTGRDHSTMYGFMGSKGFSYKEVRMLAKRFPPYKKVVNVQNYGEQDVYDLSVKDHENFATNVGIFHNCQLGDNGHLFEIKVENSDVKEELEFLFFHPRMLNMDRRLWNIAKNLFIFGDHFMELVLDPEEPKAGILQAQNLPADSIYRIETIKGKLLEFQQSKEGPDYQSLARVEVTKASPAEIAQATALRFTPEQIIHMRIGDDRNQFYPYGVSLIEPARGPAHQLRLMEDAMLVYRLSRSPERRVFYIDVGQLPPFKAEAYIARMQDQLRKKKTFNSKSSSGAGASAVEERWVAQSSDEDIWVPIRPNTNSRIETLPGAQNLGEIDDALYFRNRLFLALNFPKEYMSQEDPQVTKVSPATNNWRLARLIERLQMSLADGLVQIAIRHLELRGFPESLYEDLSMKLTSPSNYRAISHNEIDEIKYNRAMALVGSQLMSKFDIFTRILEVPEEEAKELVARSTLQQVQELKLQVMAQNPQLLGIAMPNQQPGMEMGTEAGGPSPMLTGQEGQQPPPPGQPGQLPPPPAGPPNEGQEIPGQSPEPKNALDTFGQQPKAQIRSLPEPTEDELKDYDLEIQDYSQGIDDEEVDASESDDY
jgi:hypothetical protein